MAGEATDGERGAEDVLDGADGCGDAARGCASDVAARRADRKLISTGRGDPCRTGFVEHCKVFRINVNGQPLRLSGLQLAGLGESDQFLYGYLDLCRLGYIYLHRLLAVGAAGIGDCYVYLVTVSVKRDVGLGIFEFGVAQPVAEGIGDVLVERIEITVAYIVSP